MNRMKKAAAELQSYLGKDAKGLALLANLVREANALRTELASVKAEFTDGAVATAAALERATNAEHARSNAEREAERQRSVARQLKARVAMLEKPKKEKEWSKLSSTSIDPQNAKSLLKYLQRYMPSSPKPSDRSLGSTDGERYYLTRIVDTIAPHDLHLLGAFVAVRALIGAPVSVKHDDNVRAMDTSSDYRKSVMSTYVRWRRKDIDVTDAHVPRSEPFHVTQDRMNAAESLVPSGESNASKR